MEDKWKRIPSLDFPKVIISPWYTNTDVYFFAFHSVWKSQKKYHLTLRAKRATFTFWVDKSWLKNAQNGPFWRLFEDLKLAVKQTYQTNQFWKEKNRWKIPKFQNSNASFCVIFKHRALRIIKKSRFAQKYGRLRRRRRVSFLSKMRKRKMLPWSVGVVHNTAQMCHYFSLFFLH
mgnify:FL=1